MIDDIRQPLQFAGAVFVLSMMSQVYFSSIETKIDQMKIQKTVKKGKVKKLIKKYRKYEINTCIIGNTIL